MNNKNQLRKEEFEIYDVTAFPTCLYANKSWVQKRKNCRKIQRSEVIFLRSTVAVDWVRS